MTAALVEKIARATRADMHEEAESPHNQTDVLRDFYALKIANHEALVRSILAAIDSSGTHVVVPVWPDADQVIAGAAADGNADLAIELRNIYITMLSARPKVTG